MNRILPLLVASSVMLVFLSCSDEEDICERCEYRFEYDNSGGLENTITDCREVSCNFAQCDICHHLEFNRTGLLVSGLCDSCYACPIAEQRPCVDEGDDVPRCVDLASDEEHCGECGRACDGGRTCRLGVCQ